MPVYQRTASTGQCTLSWDDYVFPVGIPVTTNKIIRPHPELTLVSATPTPEDPILFAGILSVGAGAIVEIDIPPYGGNIFISLKALTNDVTVKYNVSTNTAVPVQVGETFSTMPHGLPWGFAAKLLVSATAAAQVRVVVEKALVPNRSYP